jgi:hypothetical protein
MIGTSQNKTYASALAFRTALDERARRRQRDTGESVQLVRRCYAFEAFLRRIPRSGQPLVLKGGYLMQLRYAEGTRLTKDLDAALRDEALSTQPSEVIAQRLQAALLAVAKVPDVDFFTFDVSAPRQDLGADREFVGCRFSVVARVDSREFDTFQVDCTAGDAIVMPLVQTEVGKLFAFAGLEPAIIDAIGPAQHVAEKLHAICRDRGARVNNRVKDLFDVVVLLDRGVAPVDANARTTGRDCGAGHHCPGRPHRRSHPSRHAAARLCRWRHRQPCHPAGGGGPLCTSREPNPGPRPTAPRPAPPAPQAPATATHLSGKSFVVTGTLQSMSRDVAHSRIAACGGRVSASVSKKTDYVIVGKAP